MISKWTSMIRLSLGSSLLTALVLVLSMPAELNAQPPLTGCINVDGMQWCWDFTDAGATWIGPWYRMWITTIATSTPAAQELRVWACIYRGPLLPPLDSNACLYEAPYDRIAFEYRRCRNSTSCSRRAAKWEWRPPSGRQYALDGRILYIHGGLAWVQYNGYILTVP